MKSLIGELVKRPTNKAPVPLASRAQRNFGLLGGFGGRGYEQQMATYGHVSTLFSVVNLLASSVSRQDWKLYRKTTDQRRVYGPDMSERREVTVHPALEVWNHANNPFFTQQLFVESFQQHLDLTGEATWIIERESRFGLPVNLWPIRPDKVIPVPDPQNFIAGYVYLSPDGEQVPLQTNEVIRIKMPAPLDMFRGMGPVQPLLIDLESFRYSTEWYRNYFLNSAEPGGLIIFDEPLSDDEFKRHVMRWNEQHQGLSRAHRVAVLEGGAKWQDRSYSMRDLQTVELRGDFRDVIREAYRIHPHMLGMSEGVNRANAESAEVTFARWAIAPRLDRIKDTLNSLFLPMFGSLGKTVEFDYCNPVPEDREADNAERESKAKAFITYINAGADPELVSEYLGLPPLGVGYAIGGEGYAAQGDANRQLPPAS